MNPGVLFLEFVIKLDVAQVSLCIISIDVKII